MISKALIDSYTSHDEFVLVNNDERRSRKSRHFCGIHYINMVYTIGETHEKIGVKIKVDSDGNFG